MSDTEKFIFLYLYISSDQATKERVLKILKGEEQLDEFQDQHTHKD